MCIAPTMCRWVKTGWGSIFDKTVRWQGADSLTSSHQVMSWDWVLVMRTQPFTLIRFDRELIASSCRCWSLLKCKWDCLSQLFAHYAWESAFTRPSDFKCNCKLDYSFNFETDCCILPHEILLTWCINEMCPRWPHCILSSDHNLYSLLEEIG